MTIFDRYLQQHGHLPRARFGSRRRRIVVEAANGYISLQIGASGHAYLTRGDAIRLVKWLVPLLKKMDHDFDVEAAIRAQGALEREWLQELREQKRSRDPRKRRRPRPS